MNVFHGMINSCAFLRLLLRLSPTCQSVEYSRETRASATRSSLGIALLLGVNGRMLSLVLCVGFMSMPHSLRVGIIAIYIYVIPFRIPKKLRLLSVHVCVVHGKRLLNKETKVTQRVALECMLMCIWEHSWIKPFPKQFMPFREAKLTPDSRQSKDLTYPSWTALMLKLRQCTG